MKYAIVIFLIVTVTASPSYWPKKKHFRPIYDKAKYEPDYFRLPNTTIPEEYNITLILDPSSTSFIGETFIRIRSLVETDTIVLHSYQLFFSRIDLRNNDGELLETTSTAPLDDRHFLIISLSNNRTLAPNETYRIDFIYTARYTNYFAGVYRSSYVGLNGETRYFVTTQLQATDARDAFPCYDEPALKAIFNLHIYAPFGYTSVSNMDAIPSNQPPVRDFNVTSFRSTPLMSTYLVAFLVSDFEYLSNTDSAVFPKEYRIYTRPSTTGSLSYALDIAQKAVLFMENYTDIAYKLPKADSVAIPGLYESAMENWGLITYSEDFQLSRMDTTPASNYRVMTNVVGHENVHSWFGNEVTPVWWDYLWMNEGFASFFEYYAMDRITPSLNMSLEEQFVVSQMQKVMLDDSYLDTNPLNNPVGSPQEIDLNFNYIAYWKGSSVIRMMHYTFGESSFRSALAAYLKTSQSGTTDPETFYTEIDNVLGNSSILPEDIKPSDIFRSWADQSGYPVVTIEPIETSSAIVLTQERFHYNASHHTDERWWIPFTITTSSNLTYEPEKPRLFPPHYHDYFITIGLTYWYIANRQQMGYFRVMYDITNWLALTTMFNRDHLMFHRINRAQLIDDSMMFSRTDRLSYNITFGLMNYLRKELDYAPWYSAYNGLSFLATKMQTSRSNRLFNLYIQSLVTAAYESSGFQPIPDEGHIPKRLRNLVIDIACSHEMEDCLKKSEQQLSSEQSNITANKIDQDLREVIYCYGIKNGSRVLWDHLYNMYNKTVSPLEKILLIKSMACSSDNATINFYLNMAISNNSIFQGYEEWIVRAVATSSYSGTANVLDFLQENFIELKQKLDSSSTTNIIMDLGSTIVSDELVQEFEVFVDKYSDMFDENEQQAVETTQSNIDESLSWITTHLLQIENWLGDNVSL